MRHLRRLQSRALVEMAGGDRAGADVDRRDLDDRLVTAVGTASKTIAKQPTDQDKGVLAELDGVPDGLAWAL